MWECMCVRPVCGYELEVSVCIYVCVSGSGPTGYELEMSECMYVYVCE